MTEVLRKDDTSGLGSVSERFEDTSRRLRSPLLRFFARRTGSRWDAEELVQELFLRLHLRSDLDSLANRDGYVFQAAANLLRDKARKDKARAVGRHEDLSDYDLVADTPSPEAALVAKQRLDAAIATIDSLPPRTRTVLMLRRFEEKSYAEIAHDLGISISAVEKHLARAVQKLRADVPQCS